ncbi:MAG TPA: 23S rRNA (guanosine(2251)-2'-O)-methyltransferase RlmB [Vicinamibacterales bacterium]|nr:23S rRNA (guanosine(2251)-2'-O)-methyltransferase RlmB [Vicinamibacterales bacterium]
MLIYGVNPVREALRRGQVSRLLVQQGSGGGRLQTLLDAARAGGVRIETVERAAIDRAARGGVHQGIVAVIDEPKTWTIEGLVNRATGPALILVLDGIEDPQNLGAILRVADAAGASGVIRQTRHAAPLGGAAAKASAGAVAHVKIADVVNIARAIDELKEAGVWTVGLDAGAPMTYDAVDFRQPTAVVLGAEGPGLRRLVKERCDLLASIPMRGHVQSLNVATAAAAVLFEAVRQRR